MNKNRINEGQPLHSAAQPLKKRPAENFLVFIILAAVILALNMFSSRPGAVEQNHLPDPAEPEETYVWLSGFPGTREGLHRFAPEQLRNSFPAIAALLADMAAPAADYPVHAFQYQDDTVEQINPPPAVANIFFQPVSINRADKNVLTSLPGIGPVLAEKIVRRRNRHGPFRSKDELLHIAGIGPKKYAGLVDRITLD